LIFSAWPDSNACFFHRAGDETCHSWRPTSLFYLISPVIRSVNSRILSNLIFCFTNHVSKISLCSAVHHLCYSTVCFISFHLSSRPFSSQSAWSVRRNLGCCQGASCYSDFFLRCVYSFVVHQMFFRSLLIISTWFLLLIGFVVVSRSVSVELVALQL
jgi:hypothetical protein